MYVSGMKKDERPILLLSPYLMDRRSPAVEMLKVVRKKDQISYSSAVLNNSLIRASFRDFPKPAREILMNWSLENWDYYVQQVRKMQTVLQSNTPPGEYLETQLLQFWHKSLESFRPFFPLVKWYHRKLLPGKDRYATGPCSFSSFRPTLSFEVGKNEKGLYLITHVMINNVSYPLKSFQQAFFLLESRNEYFMLSFTDYRTLRKLQQTDMARLARNPESFAQELLADLEKDYPVNRHDFFPKKEIAIQPVHRVLLTELNNAFLMLTPQWLYDSNLAEGPWKESFEVIKDGVTHIIKRNEAEETGFVKTLESLHPNFSKQRNGYFYLSFADAQKKQWFLKTYHRLLQMDIEIAGMDMLKHFRYAPYAPETRMELVQEDDNNLVYNMEVLFGKEPVPLNLLQKALISGQRAVLLKDGSLGILGDDWLHQYATFLKHGRVKQGQVEVLRWMSVANDSDKEKQATTGNVIKQEWWEQWKRWQNTNDALFSLPDNMQVTLRPYQQKGYDWMLLLGQLGAGACLADDMGLGKTIQSIAVIAHHTVQFPGSRCIIVCPASLMYNWQQELQKFAPSLNTTIYHGAHRQKESLTEKDTRVLITTYHTMRSDADLICEQTYGVAVIDESHNIKNPSTQIAQAVMQLRARFRLALSGTPVVNNTFDLYAQLNFVVPGLFGSREFFKREYADPIDYHGNEEKILALKKLTAPFILRRTKEQVAKDLPEKTESVLWCNMTGLQREVYDGILEQTRSSIFLDIQSKGLAKAKMSILQGITRLRQACSSPALLPPEDNMNCNDSIKADVLLDELQNILGKHKVLVFSQFSTMLDILADKCTEQSIPFYHFDGQTPPAKRAEMVNAFQEENCGTHLFLISLKAGNTGLTLTAADYVFLFDPWWNTAVQDQAIDRAHRIGQTKKVFAYKMICKNTIEEKIIYLQQKKKKLSEELVTADDGFISKLSEEEVAYLFG